MGSEVLFPSYLLSCPLSQLLTAMVAKLGNREDPLPQDSFEGVDEDEWVSGRVGRPASHPSLTHPCSHLPSRFLSTHSHFLVYLPRTSLPTSHLQLHLPLPLPRTTWCPCTPHIFHSNWKAPLGPDTPHLRHPGFLWALVTSMLSGPCYNTCGLSAPLLSLGPPASPSCLLACGARSMGVG